MTDVSTAAPWLEPVWQPFNRARLQSRLPHAVLLTGAEGAGKQLLAQRIVHALLCEAPDAQGEPCGTCAACGWLRAGTHPDLLTLEPEETGKAIKVDQVRSLCVDLSITSHGGRYKVAVVRPAEAMNVNAANSLLKTLEEPTANTLLVLASAAPGRLLATVRSRCQQIQVPVPPPEQGFAWLAAHGLEGQDARRSLEMAAGAPLRALALHETGAETLMAECLEQLQAVAEGRTDPLAVASAWQGNEEALRLRSWRQWVEALIRLRLVPDADSGSELAQKLQTLVESVDCKSLYALLDRLDRASGTLGSGLNRQLVLEDLLTRWAAMRTKRQKNVMQGSR